MLVLAAAVWPARPTSLRAWVRQYRYELMSVGLLTLGGGILRLVQLATLPAVLMPPEATVGLWARQVGRMAAHPTFGNPFGALEGLGTLYLKHVDTLVQLFGAHAGSVRLGPALLGTLALPATYLLARHLLGRRAALLAASVLLMAAPQLVQSRAADPTVLAALVCVPLASYGFLTGLEQRSPCRMAFSAGSLGLYLSISTEAWLWILLFLMALPLVAIHVRARIRDHVVPLGVFLLSLALVTAPFALWAHMFPLEFSAPLRARSTLWSGWLTNEVAMTGHSALRVLVHRVQAVLRLLLLEPQLDAGQSTGAALDVFAATLWLLGCIIAIVQPVQHRLLVVQGWFWGSLLGVALLSTPHHAAQAVLLVLAPACLLIGLAGAWLLGLLAWLWPSQERAFQLGHVLVIGLLFLNSAQRQLLRASDLLHAPCYQHTPGGLREASVLGTYLNQVPPDTMVYLLSQGFGSGYNYGESPVIEFLSAGALPITLLEPLTADIRTRVEADRGALGTSHMVFVAHLTRSAELLPLGQWFPAGQEGILVACGDEVLRTYFVRF